MALIVISILVAFGLEAWWAGKQDAAEADSVRAALISEFEQNLALLTADRPQPARSHEATLALLETFSPAPSSVNADSIRSLIVTSFEVNAGFRPAVGVSATLGPSEASDFLGDSLGLLLARWQRQTESIEAQGSLLESGVVSIVAEWSRQGFPVSGFTPPGAAVPPSGFSSDFREMLSRPGVETLFASRAVELWQMAQQHSSAVELAEEILGLLRGAS